MDRRHFLQQSTFAAASMACNPQPFWGSSSSALILGQGAKKYKLDTEWGKLDAARYPVKDCHEMVQDQKGRILLLTNETRNNVIIYDKKGKLVTTWGKDRKSTRLNSSHT